MEEIQVANTVKVSEILADMGFSMLCLNVVPPIASNLKSYVSFEVEEDKALFAVSFSNVVAGSLLLAYGIMENNKAIYVSMPVLIVGSLVAIVLRLCSVRMPSRRDDEETPTRLY